MGYVAIFIGFALMVALCMFNVNVMLSAFAGALFVTVTAGLPFVDSVINVFFTRFGAITSTMFPMFLFGKLFCRRL